MRKFIIILIFTAVMLGGCVSAQKKETLTVYRPDGTIESVTESILKYDRNEIGKREVSGFELVEGDGSYIAFEKAGSDSDQMLEFAKWIIQRYGVPISIIE